MKAIKIDVKNKSVYWVDINKEDDLKSIYEHLECSTFDIVPIGNGMDMYVDDEGLLLNEPIGAFKFKYSDMQAFSGHGLIMGCNEDGESIPPPITVKAIETVIEFVSPELLPEPSFKIIS